MYSSAFVCPFRFILNQPAVVDWIGLPRDLLFVRQHRQDCGSDSRWIIPELDI